MNYDLLKPEYRKEFMELLKKFNQSFYVFIKFAKDACKCDTFRIDIAYKHYNTIRTQDEFLIYNNSEFMMEKKDALIAKDISELLNFSLDKYLCSQNLSQYADSIKHLVQDVFESYQEFDESQKKLIFKYAYKILKYLLLLKELELKNMS